MFKVCDEPHPLLIKTMIDVCMESRFAEAHKSLEHLFSCGYSVEDIIGIVFRVTKNHETMPEFVKLKFIKVGVARAVRQL